MIMLKSKHYEEMHNLNEQLLEKLYKSLKENKELSNLNKKLQQEIEELKKNKYKIWRK